MIPSATIRLRLVLTLALVGAFATSAIASVSVTPASATISADKAADATPAGTYTTLPSIVIAEPSANSDFTSPQSGVTLVLDAPTGWQFNGPCTASAAGGKDITSGGPSAPTCSVTASAVTVTFTVSGTTKQDTLTIAGIQAQPKFGASTVSGNIVRDASSTSSITGVTGATNFGTLTITPGAAKTLTMTTQPPATIGAGATFVPAPQVTVRDQFGTACSSDNTTVVTAARGATGTATLQGTLTATAASGVATFSTLSYNKAETMNLTFTSGTLTSASSANVVVTAGAASKLLFATQPGGATAGAAFATQPVVITADSFDNPSNGGLAASVPLTFSIASGTGTLLGTTAFDIGTGAGNGTVTATNLQINEAGTFTLGVSGLGSATSGSFSVAPAAADHLAMVTQPPATATAGVAFSPAPQVRIVDVYGNTRPDTTTITATRNSGSGTAALLGTTSVAAVSGTATFSNLVYNVAGETISADFIAAGVTGVTSSAVTVNPGPAASFVVTAPATATAGVSVNVTVTARDSVGNTATGYVGTVHFTSNDGAAVLPGDYTFTNVDAGVHVFSVTLKTAGTRTVTATDTVSAVVNGTSGSISVSAAAANTLAVSAPANATAGTAFSVTVTAHDSFGNTDPTYVGTVAFSSSDVNSPVLPSNYAFTLADSGTHTFVSGVTLKTAGSKTVTATDTITAAITGSATTSVSPAAVNSLTIAAPATATAGAAFNVTVTAKDAYNNTATSYTGTVSFSTSDANSPVLPANYTFTGGDAGTHTFTGGVTLKTAGTQTVSVSDGTRSATSSNIAVGASSATSLIVSGPASATAGVAVSVTVTAKDAFNNVATGYAGTIGFTSSDPAATLPSNYAFTGGDAGVHTFTNGVTLKTAGTRTVSISDGTLSATTGNIAVSPNTASSFVVTLPASATAGTAFSGTVTAKDAYNNTATAYTGTVHFTTSDANPSAPVLPANYTFTGGDAGVHTFTTGFTLKTAGTQSITATDTVSSSITGSASTSVNATTADHLAFSTQPGGATAGAIFTQQPVVKTTDAYGNLSTVGLGNNQTVSIALSSGTGTLQGTTSGNIGNLGGAGTLTLTNLRIDTTGVKQLTASSSGYTSGVSASFTVSPGTATILVFSTQPSTTTAGVSMSPAPVVQSRDGFGNVSTVGLGSPTNVALSVASGTGSISGTTSYDLVANSGTVTFSGISMTVAGTKTFGAAASGLTGATSNSFTINPAAAHHLAFTTNTPATATAGSAFSPAPVVRIEDQYNNLRSADTTSITAARSTGTATLGGTTSVNAVAGVATFSNLVYTKAETMNVAFSAAGLTGVTSNNVNVSAAAAHHLTITTQPPSSVTAGATFSPSPVVEVRDQYDNLRSGDTTSITAARSAGSGTLQGTLTVNAVAGVATFASLHHNVAGTITVAFSAAGLTGATSNNVVINPDTTSQLAITTPATATAGTPFSFTVTAQDQFGNTTPAYAQSVTFSTTDSGTSTVVPGSFNFAGQGGTHTFTNGATLTTSGNQTISVTDGTLSKTSSTIAVSPATATKYVITDINSGTNPTAGTGFTMTVETQDNYGNLANVTSNSKFGISLEAGSGTLGGTATGTVSNGTSSLTVSGITYTKAESGVQLRVSRQTGMTLADGVSGTFTVNPGTATQIVFSVQPANGTAGALLSPAPTVQTRDANGNVSTTGISQYITIALNPGTVTLNGTKTYDMVAAGGSVSFSDLQINTAGTGYTLTASLTNVAPASARGPVTNIPAPTPLSPVTSSSFNISAGAPANMTKIAGDGQTAPAESTLPTDPSVSITDSYGNPVSGLTVTFAPANASSGSVTGGTQTTNASGVATVTSWTLGQNAGTNTLNVTAGALSTTFTATGICTYTSRQSGAWSSATSWIGGCVPTSSDAATIASGHTITVTANQAAASLTFTAASANSNVVVNSGTALTVTGAVTVNSPSANGVTSTMNVGDGTLNTASISLSSTTGNRKTVLLVNNGTVNMTGSFSFSGNPPSQIVNITGSTGTINIGGDFPSGGSIASGINPAGTFHFNGGAPQTIGTYHPNDYFPTVVIDSDVTLAGDIPVLGVLRINAGHSLTASANIHLKGDFVDDGTFNGAGSQMQVIGTSMQTFSGTADPIPFDNVLMNNPAGLTLDTNISVAGILTLTSGNISAGTNTVTILAGGDVSRTSGHVIGNLAKVYTSGTAKTFEVGTANGYSPADATPTSGTYPATLTVKAVQGPHPASPTTNALQRYWTVSSSGIDAADLTIHYLDPTDIVGNELAYRFANYNSSSWFYPAATVDTTNNFATSSVTQFGDFTLHGEAVAMRITSVNSGADAIAGTPFDVVVESVDALGNTENVASPTTLSLSLVTGSGTLTAANVTIPAGSSSATFSATYTKAEVGVVVRATAISGAPLGSDDSDPFNVIAGAATHFDITAPASVAITAPFGITVTALDAYDNVSPYEGVVTFTSTDPIATLPANYTFQASDLGVHAFSNVVLSTGGPQKINADSGPIHGEATISVTGQPDLQVAFSGPSQMLGGDHGTYTAVVANNGIAPATSVSLAITAPGSWTVTPTVGCSALPCALGNMNAGETRTVKVSVTPSLAAVSGGYNLVATASTASVDADLSNNSATAHVTIGNCRPITDMSPADTGKTSGELTWNGAPGSLYDVFLGPEGSGCSIFVGSTTDNHLSYSGLQLGETYEWRVVGHHAGCPTAVSACVKFTTSCDAPHVEGLAEATSNARYHIMWGAIDGATGYVVQEASSDQFSDAASFEVDDVSREFSHAVDHATAFFYRVRAVGACTEEWSQTLRVVVVPNDRDDSHEFDITVEQGSTDAMPQSVHVPAPVGVTAQSGGFVASSNAPWVTVTPASGTISPAGVDLDLQLHPNGLAAGSTTAIVTVRTTEGAVLGSYPVTIHAMVPADDRGKDVSSVEAAVIPAVGHAAGVNSFWRSDVRMFNPANAVSEYDLFFTPSRSDGTKVGRHARVSIEPAATMALGDVVRHLFGFGNLGDSTTGTLEIRPLNDAPLPVITSRTYNNTDNGTYGQFIGAITSPKLAPKGSILSLQEIAQSSAFRTNVGIAEGSGAGADLVLRVFDANNTKLLEIPMTLSPFEQRQLDSLLGANHISSDDARIEVEVTSQEGSAAAYASVVDNVTNDPLAVPGIVASAVKATRYVVPGVAHYDTPTNTWRSEVRVFNAGLSSIDATLTFFPQGGGTPIVRTVTLAGGEVKRYDNVLDSLFGVHNVGGALHVTTGSVSSLVVTARTYDRRPTGGTYGQFIPAVTIVDAATVGGRALEILHVEQSIRFRSNIGLAEIEGKNATVQMTAFAGDGRSATKTVTLSPYEFVQYGSLLNELGLNDATNARVEVRVIAGDGAVVAYSSTIDNRTQDPTYIPAQ